jgi:hypothetical protein
MVVWLLEQEVEVGKLVAVEGWKFGLLMVVVGLYRYREYRKATIDVTSSDFWRLGARIVHVSVETR